MIDEPEKRVADIVMAAGGRLVSRVRLQKIAYLLDKLGANSGFAYAYHHYGPYSRDLDNAIHDAEAFRQIEENFESRKVDGARYSVFISLKENLDKPYTFSYLADETLRETAKELSNTNVTVLELAATAHWLVNEEQVGDWRAEIRRRKGSKTEGGKLEKATALLAQIGLEPRTT